MERNRKETSIERLEEDCSWKELTPGMQIYARGNSVQFHTGEWAVIKPKFIEENCKQCLLCIPVCPDSAIPVRDYKRLQFDYDHCKGCGICVKSCPFGAITMEGVG